MKPYTWVAMFCVATFCAGSGFGCGGKAPQKAAAPQSAATTPASAATRTEPVPASPSVGVSEDLARKCQLRFGSAEQAPKFGYNEADLLPSDRDILQQVADCLVRGPLKGRSVQLVGRADPRGTEEYNLALGSRRAESVRTYLQRLGVAASRLSPTTRGDLDASGSSETGWRSDRRVDLRLVN